MDILCEVNDKKYTYRLSVTRPTPDAAVLWLDETDSSERWCVRSSCTEQATGTHRQDAVCLIRFCNIPFDSIGDACENSESFNHAPNAVVGLVEVRYASQKGSQSTRRLIHHVLMFSRMLFVLPGVQRSIGSRQSSSRAARTACRWSSRSRPTRVSSTGCS